MTPEELLKKLDKTAKDGLVSDSSSRGLKKIKADTIAMFRTLREKMTETNSGDKYLEEDNIPTEETLKGYES